MTGLILPRRKFLTGLASLLATPAIVRAASLMPIKTLSPATVAYDSFGNAYQTYTTYFECQDGRVFADWKYIAKIVNVDGVIRG